MGLKDKFRRSRSFGPTERDDYGTPDFAASATSFHTALDVSLDSDPFTAPTSTGDRRSRNLDLRQNDQSDLFRLDSDVQLGREYQSSPIHGPGVAQLQPASEDKLKEVEDIIAALRELSKTASPDHLAAIRNALTLGAEDKAVAAAQIQDPANSALIRRKSFFQPGVATRRSPPNVLRKKQPLDTACERQLSQSWSTDMFVTSPLDKLACLKNDNIHVSIERAETPSESDYQHLGAYKLGSLRITNGAASPEPSTYFQPGESTSHNNLRRMEDYFTASEGTESYTDGRSTTNGGSVPPTPGEGEREATPLAPSNQYLKMEMFADDMRPESPASRSMTRSPGSPLGPRRPPLSRMRSAESWSSTLSNLPSAPDYLNMYSTEASSNPFLVNYSSEEAILDDDEVSRHDEYHDDTFTHVPTTELQTRKVCSQKLNGPSLTRSEHSMVLSETSSYYPDQPQEERPRSMYDSGYHSESSLKSKFSAAPPCDVDGMPLKQEAVPTLPNIKGLTNRDQREEAGMAQTKSRYYQETPLGAPSAPRGADLRNSFVESLHAIPSVGTHPPVLSTPTTPSKSPTKSSDASTPRPNKLQKKDRRKSFLRTNSSPVIVQRAQDISESDNVPAVPWDVQVKYKRRLSQNPEMENLEHTFRSASACANRADSASETVDFEKVEIRFPSPTLPEELKRSSSRGRKAKRRSIGPEAPPHRLLRSLSRKGLSNDPRKSASMPRDDEELVGVELADFGTVAASLGSSPYEQATPLTARSSQSNTNKIQHPHQISYRPVPTKNLVGMSEQQAAQLAMLRSRDRLPSIENRQAASSFRPLQSRIRDMDSRGEYRKPRPKSMASEIPPVPALPSQSMPLRPRSMYEPAGTQKDAFQQLERPDKPQDGADGWGGPARLWRQRRKSIGEGLLRRQYLGDALSGSENHESEDESVYSAPGPAFVPMHMTQRHTVSEQDLRKPQVHGPLSSLNKPTIAFPSRRGETQRRREPSPKESPMRRMEKARPFSSLHPLSAARTASPTQKIRDRAAMFERAPAGDGGAPMPPRQAAELYQRPASAASSFDGEGRRDAKLMGGPNMSMLSMSMQLRAREE